MTIAFYSTTGAYRSFSNFAPYGVEFDGAYWPTVEHYFQAQKFADLAYRERIRLAATPKQAKALGGTRALPILPNWDTARDDVMRAAVLKKFQTHTALRQVLLATGDEELVENSPTDYYWGCGARGTGKNMLGRLLMEVRAHLRAQG